jgi:EAL domain-containing protein (putative c-di-GMP-specific phosphodiesterase class I)
MGQGFLFAKPLESGQLRALLQRQHDSAELDTLSEA